MSFFLRILCHNRNSFHTFFPNEVLYRGFNRYIACEVYSDQYFLSRAYKIQEMSSFSLCNNEFQLNEPNDGCRSDLFLRGISMKFKKTNVWVLHVIKLSSTLQCSALHTVRLHHSASVSRQASTNQLQITTTTTTTKTT